MRICRKINETRRSSEGEDDRENLKQGRKKGKRREEELPVY